MIIDGSGISHPVLICIVAVSSDLWLIEDTSSVPQYWHLVAYDGKTIQLRVSSVPVLVFSSQRGFMDTVSFTAFSSPLNVVLTSWVSSSWKNHLTILLESGIERVKRRTSDFETYLTWKIGVEYRELYDFVNRSSDTSSIYHVTHQDYLKMIILMMDVIWMSWRKNTFEEVITTTY